MVRVAGDGPGGQPETEDGLAQTGFPHRNPAGRTVRLRICDVAMTNRRDVLAGALAMLAGAAAQAQSQTAQSGPAPVFQHDLPNITMDGWEVNVSVVDMPPARDGRSPHHPGFVLAYVFEGAIVTRISDQPETTYKAGQMFYEPPGSTHQVSRNAGKTEP